MVSTDLNTLLTSCDIDNYSNNNDNVLHSSTAPLHKIQAGSRSTVVALFLCCAGASLDKEEMARK